jgi:hypothetical protein
MYPHQRRCLIQSDSSHTPRHQSIQLSAMGRQGVKLSSQCVHLAPEFDYSLAQVPVLHGQWAMDVVIKLAYSVGQNI